jgi:hypothetical protein
MKLEYTVQQDAAAGKSVMLLLLSLKRFTQCHTVLAPTEESP